MSIYDIAGVTLLIFISSLIVVGRIKQEITWSNKKINDELLEIKKILERIDKHN